MRAKFKANHAALRPDCSPEERVFFQRINNVRGMKLDAKLFQQRLQIKAETLAQLHEKKPENRKQRLEPIHPTRRTVESAQPETELTLPTLNTNLLPHQAHIAVNEFPGQKRSPEKIKRKIWTEAVHEGHKRGLLYDTEGTTSAPSNRAHDTEKPIVHRNRIVHIRRAMRKEFKKVMFSFPQADQNET